mmetsp:Transcript_89350/g.207992  ORF Transcript_89350/g.207992 Transcript_89350/m.207992 type:complete len:269 (-) Transcript_89350:616-1422(-)
MPTTARGRNPAHTPRLLAPSMETEPTSCEGAGWGAGPSAWSPVAFPAEPAAHAVMSSEHVAIIPPAQTPTAKDVTCSVPVQSPLLYWLISNKLFLHRACFTEAPEGRLVQPSASGAFKRSVVGSPPHSAFEKTFSVRHAAASQPAMAPLHTSVSSRQVVFVLPTHPPALSPFSHGLPGASDATLKVVVRRSPLQPSSENNSFLLHQSAWTMGASSEEPPSAGFAPVEPSAGVPPQGAISCEHEAVMKAPQAPSGMVRICLAPVQLLLE